MHLTEHEQLVFDIYFASVVSMARHHPGAGRSNGYSTAPDRLSVDACAEETLKMIEKRREIFAN